MVRALFVDRDGVLNEKMPEGTYVTRPELLRVLPGVPEAVARMNRAGWRVVVVTNQRGIARGLFTEEDLAGVHRFLVVQLGEARLDAIYHCPHAGDAGCGCRKPAPGMLLRAAAELDLDLGASWMVGDHPSDVEAGRRAGVRTVWITREGASWPAGQTRPDGVEVDLPAAVEWIISQTGAAERDTRRGGPGP